MSQENQIKLYHYTRVGALRNIMESGVILPGQTALPNGTSPLIMISLTTDPTGGSGHGLPDGRRIDRDQLQHHSLYQVVRGAFFSSDATVCRIGLTFDLGDPRLISVLDFYKNAPDLLDYLECSAYFPTKKITSGDVTRIKKAFASGQCVRRGPTWYYYKGKMAFRGDDVAFRAPKDTGEYLYLPAQQEP